MNDVRRKANIIYAVIGVLTLMVTVAGATFAYYTANRTVNNVITGDMATVTFGLTVTKMTNVDQTNGLIPMTNSMVEKAVNTTARGGTNSYGICVDDNGNPVCQIYKIVVTNTGTSSMFVDGYVTLTGGSGVAVDYASSPTTMRWAQVFCRESTTALTFCTTAGTATVRQSEASGFTWSALGSTTGAQHDTAEIKTAYSGTGGVTGNATISGNTYPVINTNYIRVSLTPSASGYVPANDVTSALAFNQFLAANDNTAANNTGHSYSGDSGTTPATYVDAQIYYIVVWLSETGTNQTVGGGGTNVPSNPVDFFHGTVTFISSNGNEITSVFNGYSRVS